MLEALAEAGIDMDDVTDKLLREGVDAFVTPMEKLLAGIEAKREAIFTGRPETIDSSLPDELEPMIAELVARAEPSASRAGSGPRTTRCGARRGQAEVADRLGWLSAHETYGEQIDDLEAFASEAAEAGFTRHRAARHGRLVAGAGGAAPLVRLGAARSPAPARARLDRPRRGARAGARASTSSTRCFSSRRSPAARSRRSRCSSTSGSCARTASSSSRSPTRARRCRSSRPSAASGARSSTTPTSAGATAR